MPFFPLSETTFLLPGPAGSLEVLTTPADEGVLPLAATAVICHPHPLHGGTMHNKVVTTLARVFRELGLRTVRFNFRGVGKSAGEFADGVGEKEDLLAVVEWVRSCFPEEAVWLAGFSFGAYVSACATAEVKPARLVSIAPQVSRFYEVDLPPITVPWIVVQGEQDEVVPPAEVFAWVETLDPKPHLIRMSGAGHFFHGRLMELRGLLKQCLIS